MTYCVEIMVSGKATVAFDGKFSNSVGNILARERKIILMFDGEHVAEPALVDDGYRGVVPQDTPEFVDIAME